MRYLSRVLAVAMVLTLVGCARPADPPPGWSAVYFHALAIDDVRNPITGRAIDMVADVIASQPAQFYDQDTGKLRDYPVSVSKRTPYILPFWFNATAHANISVTVYMAAEPGTTLICYVSDKAGKEYPGSRTEKINRTADNATIQSACYYNV